MKSFPSNPALPRKTCRWPIPRAWPTPASPSPPISSLANAYTGRGNLVAVVSNGTAVLGLGNIGPLAGKPVMEGKSVLFKVFADVNAYDIDLALTASRRVHRSGEGA